MASRALYAVSTLNFAVSITNLRVEILPGNSRSMTRKQGLTISPYLRIWHVSTHPLKRGMLFCGCGMELHDKESMRRLSGIVSLYLRMQDNGSGYCSLPICSEPFMCS